MHSVRAGTKSARRPDPRVLFQLRLRPELATKLKAKAVQEDLSMSAWVRRLIAGALNQVAN